MLILLVGGMFTIGMLMASQIANAAEPEIPTRILNVPGGSWGTSYDIIKFVDPDNGNVCYITAKCGYACGAISCLKP